MAGVAVIPKKRAVALTRLPLDNVANPDRCQDTYRRLENQRKPANCHQPTNSTEGREMTDLRREIEEGMGNSSFQHISLKFATKSGLF